jgi:RNA polymerase sigma factor (sigma-70 family)
VVVTGEIEDLAKRASAGDQEALGELLKRVEPDVLQRCRRLLPCPEDAEEAAQDALLDVARGIGQFESRSKFTTWLYVVATNSSRRKYRELRRRAAEHPMGEAAPLLPDPRTTSVIAGSRVDFLDALERLEREHPSLVVPLVYRDVCEMDYAEIVMRTGLPLGTVKSRLHTARGLVRGWLAPR